MTSARLPVIASRLAKAAVDDRKYQVRVWILEP